jgi:hypothetical protein
MRGYTDLFNYGWKEGIYHSPIGYEHPWLCVTKYGTTGHWTREEARRELRNARAGCSEAAIHYLLIRETEERFLEEVYREFTGKRKEEE